MATVNVISAQAISQTFPGVPANRLRNVRLLVAVTAGQAGYLDPTTGKYGLCNTNTSGKQQFRGIFMRAGAAGDVVAMMSQGEIDGFDLSGSNFDDILYAQDTDGLIGTAAGTKNVPIGRVVSLADGFGTTQSKALLLQAAAPPNF